MVHFLLGSHGTLASGVKSSLTILLGAADNLTVIDAYVDDHNITQTLQNYFEEIPEDEQVIMMSDLYGGSVNQMMYPWLERPHTKLISGVNLALVLELVAGFSGEGEITDEQISEKIMEARETMKLVELETDEEEENEDFF